MTRSRLAALLLAALAGLPLAAAPAAAQSGGARAGSLDDAIARHTPAIIQLRHAIHQNPELSNRETETASLIADHLRGTGLEPRTGIAKTGVVAILRGGRGKQAHGARPEESVDPIVMASQAVMALQTIRSRNISPIEPGLVTVGILRGGQRSNIIRPKSGSRGRSARSTPTCRTWSSGA